MAMSGRYESLKQQQRRNFMRNFWLYQSLRLCWRLISAHKLLFLGLSAHLSLKKLQASSYQLLFMWLSSSNPCFSFTPPLPHTLHSPSGCNWSLKHRHVNMFLPDVLRNVQWVALKSVFNLIQNRLTWIWQCFIMLVVACKSAVWKWNVRWKAIKV